MFGFRRERRAWSLGGGRGARATSLKVCRPGLDLGDGVGGTSQCAAEEHRLIQPELVGRGCIYHPITVTNPSSTT